MVELDKEKPVYVISVVAEMLSTTQQQLRIYEKEKLCVPKRTKKNTRLYSQSDVESLQRIISLHQDLGVNLAGIEVILSLRSKIDEMENEFAEFVKEVQERFGTDLAPGRYRKEECTYLIILTRKQGLVPLSRSRIASRSKEYDKR